MNRSKLKNHLMDLDCSFSELAQTSGVGAWDVFLAEDAVMVTNGHREYLTGKTAILRSLNDLYRLKKLIFFWEPKLCEVSEDGTMGYTSGIYTRTYLYQDNPHKEIGKYTTIWKKRNEEWKIVLDIGNEEVINEM